MDQNRGRIAWEGWNLWVNASKYVEMLGELVPEAVNVFLDESITSN